MRSVSTLLARSGWGARGAFLLAGVAALAVRTLPVEVGPAPGRAPPAEVPVGGPSAAEGAALSRPLFDPGRRPWTAQGGRDLILRPDPATPVLVLRGIRVDGGQARAFLDDGGGDRSWLAVGEGRGDWTIAAIGPDQVSVAQRGRRIEAEFLGRPATLRPAPFADAPPDLRP